MPVIRLDGIVKSYPGVRALRSVNFSLDAGVVRSIVGENGAGKSTIVKVMGGAIAPDDGVMRVRGKALSRFTPAAAAGAGVAVLHQERHVALDLTATENVLLGAIPTTRLGRVDWRRAHRTAAALMERVGLHVAPTVVARTLTVAEQQLLELARALAGDAALVIMDEPTASLGPAETSYLFRVIERLKQEGKSVIFVSHHLDEVLEVSDEITVMRDGQIVAELQGEGVTKQGLTDLMFGESMAVLERAASHGAISQEVVLEVRELGVDRVLEDVSLSVRRGEILCITGGIGSGRRELSRCLAGALKPDRGTLVLAGRERRFRSPRHALGAGVVLIPEDRKREGILAGRNVAENVDLARITLGRSPLAPPRRSRTVAERYVRELAIKCPSAQTHIDHLSGGNQQKALVARSLNANASVLVFDEPTAGVDINTKLEIYEVLRKMKQQGRAMVVFSSDTEELKLLADRLLVLSRGRIVKALAVDEISDAAIAGSAHA